MSFIACIESIFTSEVLLFMIYSFEIRHEDMVSYFFFGLMWLLGIPCIVEMINYASHTGLSPYIHLTFIILYVGSFALKFIGLCKHHPNASVSYAINELISLI